MYGIDNITGTPTMPAQEPAVSSGFFQGGVPATNTPATTISVDWLNGITSELLNLVTAAGLTPTKATLTQVTAAVKALGKTGPGLQNLYFSTPVSMAGGTTVLIGPSGVSTSDLGSRWIIPFTTGTIIAVYLSASAAPTGVQTVTGTVYVNGVASAAVSTITGSATNNSATTAVAVAATNGLSVHLVSSATAATAYISGYIVVQAS